MSGEENENDQVYRVDTVPPPDGEADAYNAPTRVGAMAATTIAEMLLMGAAAEDSAALPAPPLAQPRASAPPQVQAPAVSEPVPVPDLASLPQVNPSSTISSMPPPRTLEDELGMGVVPTDSVVPRLNAPEEDETGQSNALANEAQSSPPPLSSFEPMSLSPQRPPMFSRLQLVMMLAIVVSAALGIYLLFR